MSSIVSVSWRWHIIFSTLAAFVLISQEVAPKLYVLCREMMFYLWICDVESQAHDLNAWTYYCLTFFLYYKLFFSRHTIRDGLFSLMNLNGHLITSSLHRESNKDWYDLLYLYKSLIIAIFALISHN